MSYFKKFLIAVTLLALPLAAQAKMEKFKIDAEQNAVRHNNMGVVHMQDRYYAAAIKEFQLAVMLNPDKQATAVYYANLANCYMKIGYPALAEDSLQRAVKLYPMNFAYYRDLVTVYKKLGVLEQKRKFYAKASATNPLSQVMVGLILVAQGKKDAGYAKLQEFVYTEPDLIITGGVKSFIGQQSKEPF